MRTSKMKKKEARRKPLLKPDSDAFKASKTFILDKNMLTDLQYLIKFFRTGCLDIYHAYTINGYLKDSFSHIWVW